MECGWGECPHLRWKVDVSVLTGEGQPAAGATVRATYPDGRTDEKVTDGAGTAVLYLPSGDNRLDCRHMGQSGGVNAPVDGAPAAAAIRLEEKRQIFIVYYFADYADELKVGHDCAEFGELYAMLSVQYPDAVWLKWREEWLIHTGAEVAGYAAFPSATTLRNDGLDYSLEGLQAAYGLSPGDIVIFLRSCKESDAESNDKHPVYFDTGYYQLYVGISIALLPQETQEEPAQLYFPYRSQATLWCENGFRVLDDYSLDWTILRAWYDCEEGYRQGLQYDGSYRIEETGTEKWTEWEDQIFSGEEILAIDFYTNCQAQPYLAQFAQRALPYIDLLLEDNWEDGLEALTGGEAPWPEG